MFVPKRQNLSQAPRDRFNIASAARRLSQGVLDFGEWSA